MRKSLAVAVTVAAFVGSALPAAAAPPDGPGPWADAWTDFTQGVRSNFSAVPPQRSDPSQALGAPDGPLAPPDTGTFVSLGFFFENGQKRAEGGRITLLYDNVICNAAGNDVDVQLFESTYEPYPDELVDVYASSGGPFTLVASDVNKDAALNLPIPVATQIKLVDKSPIGAPRSTPYDGYDVDAVGAANPRADCTEDEGRKTGGGSVFTASNRRVTHGFELHCDPADEPNNLQVNWGGNRFHLASLSRVICVDGDGIEPQPPVAPFDVYIADGTGSYNGQPGHSIHFEFTDAGEPGAQDTALIIIKDAGGNTVLDVSGPINRGNQQAHR